MRARTQLSEAGEHSLGLVQLGSKRARCVEGGSENIDTPGWLRVQGNNNNGALTRLASYELGTSSSLETGRVGGEEGRGKGGGGGGRRR